MSAYTTQAGDTFATVSRRVYGDDQHASLIAQANPGTFEPMLAGLVLVVPTVPGAPAVRQVQTSAVDPDETAVLIDGKRFRFWDDIRLTRSLDTMDTVELSAPFQHDAPGFRDVIKPFSYKPLIVTIGGELSFTGTLIGVNPTIANDRKTLQISGYSRPGVLNDCTAPASMYPLVHFEGMALPEIAKALAKPFGLSVVFNGPPGSAVERLSAGASETVLAFLSVLAKERSLVISSTPAGELLFQQAAPLGRPVASLIQGSSPVLSVTPSFSPQEYFSHVTGIESVILGTEGSAYTVKNPHLAGIIRPLVFEPSDVVGGDVQEAVRAKVGRMFGNMAAYQVEVDTWRDSSNRLWSPNTTISLHAPDAMIYKPYEFVIRSVQRFRDGERKTATLDLVLPGAFSGSGPEVMPWDT